MKSFKETKEYYEFNTESYKSVLIDAKSQGYNYLFRWVNSDESWFFFQTTFLKAEKAAIELYMKEKKSNLEAAKHYYSEYIDVIEVKEELKNI